jgi:hypothetical protein
MYCAAERWKVKGLYTYLILSRASYIGKFSCVPLAGYGHQATSTNNGRIVCVFYAMVGVPLNGILIAAIGNVFSEKVRHTTDFRM